MKNEHIGLDGISFQMKIENPKIGLLADKHLLLNPTGKPVGFVKFERNNNAIISFCLPKFIRDDNLLPFTYKDTKAFDDIWDCLQSQLKPILGNLEKCHLKNVECNITKKVLKNCRCSQVLDLINCSNIETVSAVFEGASTECKYKKEKQSLKITVKNYYGLKVYNKSLEAKRHGIFTDDELLRMEIIMCDRIIKRLFGELPTLHEVLRKESLDLIVGEYKRIFSQIVKQHIKPCLNGIKKILRESLHEYNSPLLVIAMHRDIILDQNILREAMYYWYLDQGYPSLRARRNADSMICRTKGCDLPQNVIKTIGTFSQLCR